ncbi:MAG: HAD family hydrolase, partial [Deltaproteobacteria bacterium]|nr:HAD family hydrolase [Deltaproteobacteria bacterium]
CEEVRYLVGEGIRRLLEKATGHSFQSEQTEAMVADFMEYYSANLIVHTQAYVGIRQMLETLAAEHWPLAVCSNKAHELTGQLIGHFFPAVLFCMVLGKKDNAPSKPDPSGALQVIEAMNLPASEVAFIGDTGIDMDTAKNSGAVPIGVSWGFRPREELVEHGAKIILDRPEELVGLPRSAG